MIKIKLNDLPARRGTIKRILVNQGDHIKAFETILIVQCENKEIPIISLLDGYIDSIFVEVNQKVKRGETIVIMKTELHTTSLTEEKENPADLFSEWEHIDEVPLLFDNPAANDKLLNADFTEKFVTTELITDVSNQDALKLDATLPNINSASFRSSEKIDNNIAKEVKTDAIKNIVQEMQDRNAVGVSKFREKILNKLNNLQGNSSSKINKENKQITDNVSDVPPLSFREIIMRRVNKIQKVINENKNDFTNNSSYAFNQGDMQKEVFVDEGKSVINDENLSSLKSEKLSYTKVLVNKKQKILSNERDKIAHKINLIRNGEINQDSDLKDIQEIVNNSSDDWKSNDITLQYRPSKYNKKDQVAEGQIIKDEYEKKLVKLVNDVSVNTTPTDLISEFAPTSKAKFFNAGLSKESELVSKSVKNESILKTNLSKEQKVSLVEQNLTSPISYDIPKFENKKVAGLKSASNRQLKNALLESREKVDISQDKVKTSLWNPLESGRNYPLPSTLNCEIDMTEIISLRERMLSNSKTNELRLSYKVFILKAISLSLEHYPQLNGTYDAENNELIIKHYHNIGIVVQSSQGMQIPVINSVNELSILKLDEAIEKTNQRIRDNSANEADFANSTITVTDFGVFGAISGTSLLYHSNVAVIGVGKILRKPIVWGQNIAIRHMMYFSVTFDQRVLDSNLVGHFLEDVKNNLEKPYVLSLS